MIIWREGWDYLTVLYQVVRAWTAYVASYVSVLRIKRKQQLIRVSPEATRQMADTMTPQSSMTTDTPGAARAVWS
jgi:hypothetical protein